MSDLLTTYRPTKVFVQLDPDLANGSYSGRVKIDYEFSDETLEIKIQASRDFQFTSVRIATFYEFNEGYPVYSSVDSENYSFDAEAEVLTIPLANPLTPENTQNGFYIALEWSGLIGGPDTTEGFHAIDESTIEADLRAGNARKVLPSYEGGVAAKFGLAVITDVVRRVESSLDDGGSEDYEGRVKYNFYKEEAITFEDIYIKVTPLILD